MHRGRMEVLMRRTVGGENSRVFLLGTVHDTAQSRRDVAESVEVLRPQKLFLELDNIRASRLHKFRLSEFFVARRKAEFLGIDVVYGDQLHEDNFAMVEKRLGELLNENPSIPEEVLMDRVTKEIVIG
ncbi:hypothetical protein A2U01_0001246, partial [Trifolium medium]|nr:hypothetical protein [Trifolium medium]